MVDIRRGDHRVPGLLRRTKVIHLLSVLDMGMLPDGIKAALLKAVILFGIVLLINVAFRVMEPFGLGEGMLQTKWQHYQSMADEIDAVYIGSSRVLRHLDPVVIDDKVQECKPEFKSYNLGLSGISMYRNLYVVRKLIHQREHKPRYIFLEIAPFIRPMLRNVGSSGQSFYIDTENLLLAASLARDEKEMYPPHYLRANATDWLFRLFHAGYGQEALEWHNPLQTHRGFAVAQWVRKRGYANVKREELLANTAAFDSIVQSFDREFYLEAANFSHVETRVFLEILRSIESEAEQHGVKVIHLHNLRRERDRLAFSLFRELGKNKISLHRFDAFPEFQSYRAWYDLTHLNPESAGVLSAYFAEQICESGLLDN